MAPLNPVATVILIIRNKLQFILKCLNKKVVYCTNATVAHLSQPVNDAPISAQAGVINP